MPSKRKITDTYLPRKLGDLALLISDHIPAMLAYWDKDLVCRYANSAYIEWFAKPKEEMINKIRIDELLGPLYEKNLPYIKEVLHGRKQIFEREIPIPGGGGIRHSLATYIPDINNGEVLGFFVHVADVTYLKQLEHELFSAKRETLRKIIETEEAEKMHLVDILRESVNQRLVACKMSMAGEQGEGINSSLNKHVSESLSEIIQELNLLCENMAPTEIELLGLVDTIEMYLSKLGRRHGKTIYYVLKDYRIEEIMLKDKYAVFRIVQNFTTLAFEFAGIKNMELSILYTAPYVKITFITDATFLLDKSSKEYHTIASRIDNYSGKLTEYIAESKKVFEVAFSIK